MRRGTPVHRMSPFALGCQGATYHGTFLEAATS
jgi:hypothetical protein